MNTFILLEQLLNKDIVSVILNYTLPSIVEYKNQHKNLLKAIHISVIINKRCNICKKIYYSPGDQCHNHYNHNYSLKISSYTAKLTGINYSSPNITENQFFNHIFNVLRREKIMIDNYIDFSNQYVCCLLGKKFKNDIHIHAMMSHEYQFRYHFNRYQKEIPKIKTISLDECRKINKDILKRKFNQINDLKLIRD